MGVECAAVADCADPKAGAEEAGDAEGDAPGVLAGRVLGVVPTEPTEAEGVGVGCCFGSGVAAGLAAAEGGASGTRVAVAGGVW